MSTPRVVMARSAGRAEVPLGSAQAGQPGHGLLRCFALNSLRESRSVHHDDRNLQLACRGDFGVGVRSAGIFADKALDGVSAQKRQLVRDGKRAASHYEFITEPGQRELSLLDDAQQKAMAFGLARKGGKLLASDGQKNVPEAWRERVCGGGHVRHRNPLITGYRRPSCSFHGEQWNTQRCAGADRVLAHLRGKRVGGIDHMGNASVLHKTYQALNAAKTSHATWKCGCTARQRCTGVRVNGLDSCCMQLNGQKMGIKSAA